MRASKVRPGEVAIFSMRGMPCSGQETPVAAAAQTRFHCPLKHANHPSTNADVAELVDARDLKSLDGNVVWVRVPPPAPSRIAYTCCPPLIWISDPVM